MSPTETTTPQPQAAETHQQPDAAALQKEIENLKGQVAEHQRTTQFWYEKAAAAVPKAPKSESKSEPEDDVDILDVITTKGSKGLDDLLAKRGYVRGADVDQKVNAKAAELVREQELIKRYPDLAADKRDSDFFRATAAEYQRLTKDGVPGHMAMELAASSTELAMLKSGKLKTPDQEKAERDAKREKDRLARIAAQSSDKAPRAAEPEEGDEDVTPQEEQIIRGMLLGQPGADGKPMDMEAATAAFKKRATQGVRMSNRSRR
jgi:flagellin-like hook-associated protein FlgL